MQPRKIVLPLQKIDVDFYLPEFNATRIVVWKFHVNDSTKDKFIPTLVLRINIDKNHSTEIIKFLRIAGTLEDTFL